MLLCLQVMKEDRDNRLQEINQLWLAIGALDVKIAAMESQIVAEQQTSTQLRQQLDSTQQQLQERTAQVKRLEIALLHQKEVRGMWLTSSSMLVVKCYLIDA